MTGVDQDGELAQNFNHQIFIGLCGGHAQDGIPATVYFEALAGGLIFQEMIQLLQIIAQTIEQHRLNVLPLFEQYGRS